MNVLFVCTGNICRSPLAEVMARDLYDGDDITFSSAGTYALDGNPASRTGIEAAALLGLELAQHRARQLTSELLADTDIVFVMEEGHGRFVRSLDGEVRIRLLDPDGSEIPDPYGADLPSYLAVYETIRNALELQLPTLV